MSSLVLLVSLVMTVIDCLRLYPAINVNSHLSCSHSNSSSMHFLSLDIVFED